jgi:hypothetical protein
MVYIARQSMSFMPGEYNELMASFRENGHDTNGHDYSRINHGMNNNITVNNGVNSNNNNNNNNSNSNNVHQVTVIDLRSNMTSHIQESTWTNAEHGYVEPSVNVELEQSHQHAANGYYGNEEGENWDHNLQVRVANAIQASAMNGTLLNNPTPPIVEVEKQENRNTLWLGGFHNDTVSEQEIRQFFGPLGDAVSIYYEIIITTRLIIDN